MVSWHAAAGAVTGGGDAAVGQVGKVSRDCGIEDKGRLYLTAGGATGELLVSWWWVAGELVSWW